jgi:hypothetical protein
MVLQDSGPRANFDDSIAGTRIVVLLLAAISTATLHAQSAGARIVVDDLSALKAEFQLPCLTGRHVLMEEFGSPVILATEELRRRAIRAPAIIAPAGTPAPESVTVYIAIDEKGAVACANLSNRARQSLGRIGDLALETAKKWAFQPTLRDTKPVPCIGQLELQVLVGHRSRESSSSNSH